MKKQSFRAGTVAVALAGALALAGCGGDGDVEMGEAAKTPQVRADGSTTGSEPSASVPVDDGGGDAAADEHDACELLGAVDAAALLGEPLGEPEAETETCVVRAASAESHGGVTLVVSSMAAAGNYDNRVELYGVDTEVSGLGDKAFHSGPYLVVLDGDVLVQLQVVRDASAGAAVEDVSMEEAMAAILEQL